MVLERVGSGGMGVVYAAYDPQLDRKVALKLMHRGGADASARLLREAQAAARLTNPNVITVHDVGQFGDDIFLASEFVDGGTLADWLSAHPSPRAWREVLPFFLDAGRGLVAAHAHGVVHRDVKPANVLLGRDGRVLVCDFGLSRASGVSTGETSADPRLTATGTLLARPRTWRLNSGKAARPMRGLISSRSAWRCSKACMERGPSRARPLRS